MVAGNDDLHPLIKALNQTAARIREDVQKATGEIEKIRELVEHGVDTIRDAIQESIQANAELKLMEHVMEAKAVKPQIEAEHDQIETERNELDERLAAIDERYREQHQDLDETAAERIRTLGEHIFEIEEDEFEEGIEEPFTDLVTTTWRGLQAHNDEVHEERESDVKETVGDAVQTIHDFVDRQNDLVESIDDHRLDEETIGVSPDEVRRLQVPYYVVEYEANGVKQREVVPPSTVQSSVGDEWCKAGLRPITGATDLIGDRTPHVDGESDPTRSRDITASLEAYGNSTSLGFEYGETVAAVLPERQLSVTVEGGGD